MPIHDWARIRAGTFHYFHQRWIQDIAEALNTGGLPAGYFAMSEQRTDGPEPDVLTLRGTQSPADPTSGGVAVDEAPPRTRVVSVATDAALYARRADRITVNLEDGEVVAVIEIVSAGNKESANALRQFTRKAVRLIRSGIHLLVIDLHPPSRRDPRGIHPVIWERFNGEPYSLPPDQPFTLASYCARSTPAAYVENAGVGQVMPDMPLFLTEDRYVPCPLERTYQRAWAAFPQHLRTRIENPQAG